MSQTTLLSSINRTTDYPITVSSTADSHCGTLQLILGNDWTNQMIHELPAINISILTADGSKFLSFDVNMSTVNEELRNKDRSLTPTEPYSIAVYDIPKDITFSITPLFDQYALKAHNDLINDGNIEIFDTSDKGIVDTDSEDYVYRLWTTPTDTFDITIIFDNSNVSSGGSSGGGGGGDTPTAANVSYSNTTSGLSATNVQAAIDEIDNAIDNLPEPMIFKGSLGTGGTITTLPTASNDNKGFTYKVITAGTYAGQTAKIGDTFISDGTAWVLIPSGDEPSGTVTNVAVTSTDGSATITGSPITSSGTIDISVSVDNELSNTSTKPVQNKVVTSAINEKLSIEDAVGKNVTGTEYTIDGQTVIAGDGAEIFNDYVNNKAAGEYSHAEGFGNTASGAGAHVEGYGGVRATGQGSHAEGGGTTASGLGSHAEGGGATAIGEYAHSEGRGTMASGPNSHAEGLGARATGDYAHAEGAGTIASGPNSHAESGGTTASGNSSHAEGAGTTASGFASHAEGYFTVAASSYQHVQGQYNVSDSNDTYAFIIGNGTGGNARHNAFAIDWNGNIYVNNSATGVNVETLSSILNPISESEYDALTTKDKPLYFIYD